LSKGEEYDTLIIILLVLDFINIHQLEVFDLVDNGNNNIR
jgi:hypothetical protein